MRTQNESSRRIAALGALGGAMTMAGIAVVHLTHDQSGENTVRGLAEHGQLAMLSLGLVLLVAPVLMLGQMGSRRAALVACAGQLALAALATASNALGHDPSFFTAVAVPANLAILGGWAALGWSLRRAGAAPRWLAVGLPLSLVLSIPLSQVGGGLITAVFWIGVARHTLADEHVRIAPVAVHG